MRGILKKYVKGVPSRGEGGGSATWHSGPNMGVFLNEPSLSRGPEGPSRPPQELEQGGLRPPQF